jgi:hypothetical protein
MITKSRSNVKSGLGIPRFKQNTRKAHPFSSIDIFKINFLIIRKFSIESGVVQIAEDTDVMKVQSLISQLPPFISRYICSWLSCQISQACLHNSSPQGRGKIISRSFVWIQNSWNNQRCIITYPTITRPVSSSSHIRDSKTQTMCSFLGINCRSKCDHRSSSMTITRAQRIRVAPQTALYDNTLHMHDADIPIQSHAEPEQLGSGSFRH